MAPTTRSSSPRRTTRPRVSGADTDRQRAGRRGAPRYTPAMSARPIVLLGAPRLRLRGEPVESFGRFLHGLLDDMTDTMRHAPGVGLAAPQVGEALQACVI